MKARRKLARVLRAVSRVPRRSLLTSRPGWQTTVAAALAVAPELPPAAFASAARSDLFDRALKPGHEGAAFASLAAIVVQHDVTRRWSRRARRRAAALNVAA